MRITAIGYEAVFAVRFVITKAWDVTIGVD